VPAAAFLCHLAFLLQPWQHAIQVVLLDAHLRRQLGDGDTGLALDERKRLGGACPTAFATPGAATARRTTAFFGRFGDGSCRFCPMTEPRGRPGPRRRGVALALELAALDPPTPARAEAAASRRLYSSTAGFSSFSRSVISRRFSSRKSVTIRPLH
jgi:hypothetical protein